MPRTARLVVPGYPHHITQRGIRGHRTFFGSTDYLIYMELFRERLAKSGVSVWAYCLMPNHVHVVAVPADELGLARLFRPLHSQYARKLNAVHGWRGHLWQERFYSVVMDEKHTMAAMRYVEMNPVRARLCARADEWRWSSIHSNLGDHKDGVVDTAATRRVISCWRDYMMAECPASVHDSLREHTRTGRPAGDDGFIDELEKQTGKTIRQTKPGPRRD